MKKIVSATLCAALIASLCACGGDGGATGNADASAQDTAGQTAASDNEATAAETDAAEEEKKIDVIKDGASKYSLVHEFNDSIFVKFSQTVAEKTGVTLNSYIDKEDDSDFEILLGADNRAEYKRQVRKLKENEFSITHVTDGGKSQIILAYTSPLTGMAASRMLIKEMMTSEGLSIPEGLSVTGTCTEDDVLIVSSIEYLRDPAILVDDGVYYAYGTGWSCYKNTSGSLKGEWTRVENFYVEPDDLQDHEWAPEVHKYNGAYYMFATYRSKTTQHRGCTVMRADSPEGPFVEISDGFLTPSDWDAIDATLYIDTDGQPWMVFAHEWTSTPGNIGSFAAAKLSDDLTHFISEPIELFKATDAKWAITQITDGCFMHTSKDGDLCMIWSNFDGADAYCVGVAKSDNGKVDGNWIQEERAMFSTRYTGGYDGGHGMLFTDTDGTLYMSIHSPNTHKEGGRRETPVFVPLVEKNGSLVWEFLDWS